MTFIRRMVRSTLIIPLALAPFAHATAAAATGSEGEGTSSAVTAAAASPTPDSTPTPKSSAPVSFEEQLRTQAALLEEMRQLLVKQQAEIDTLKSELTERRASAAAPPAGTHAAATTPVSGEAEINIPADGVATTQPAAQDDDLAKKIEELNRKWGRFQLSGDLRVRYEGFYNQGFDQIADVNPRNRLRVRVRAQLSSEINKNFDWAIRLATGGFNDPISTNQTLSEFFDRKPIEVDRAYLHYRSRTNPVEFEAFGGKFEGPWLKSFLTFDNDFSAEGLSEVLKFNVNSSKLKSVKLTAWELPFRERSVGADGAILGAQILTDWKWSKNWSTSLGATFNDYEQVDLIAPVLNTPPTTVNSGLDYGSTNTIVVNPFTNLPEFRSEFRVAEAIGEVRYTGFNERWPLLLRANWVHNTSAFNNQKDGGVASLELGRRQEQGDWFFGYDFWKTERESNPSVFMESDLLQTNSLAHRFTVSYSYLRNVRVETQYIVNRRLQTTSPENRWLNRLQFDVMYRF